MEIIFWGFSETFFLFAVLLMILRNLFEFLISLKKNNSKIEIWDSENFWLELEIVVSKKLQKNKQTNIRLHLETAALPTELYPCICVKLFSLQAFRLREVSYHKRHPKVKIFWKIVLSNRQFFERSEIVELVSDIKRKGIPRQARMIFLSQQEQCLSTLFSLYRDRCSYTPRELETFQVLGLRYNWAVQRTINSNNPVPFFKKQGFIYMRGFNRQIIS